MTRQPGYHWRIALEARKAPGLPYAGSWQGRRTGLWRCIATWREERRSRRGYFDRFRLRLRQVDDRGVMR